MFWLRWAGGGRHVEYTEDLMYVVVLLCIALLSAHHARKPASLSGALSVSVSGCDGWRDCSYVGIMAGVSVDSRVN